MRASTVERRRTETEVRILDYLISIADPKTGRVAVSGAGLADELGIGSQTARTYLAGMVKEGTLVQISEVKRGNPTLYRVPSMVRGDVVTHYENVFLPNEDEVFEEEYHVATAIKEAADAAEKAAEYKAMFVYNPEGEKIAEEPCETEFGEMERKYHEWQEQQKKQKEIEEHLCKQAEADYIISPLGVAKDVLQQTDYLTVRVFEEFLRIRRALERLVKEVEDGKRR